MPEIPSNINEVEVEFSPTVIKSVDQALIDALKAVVKKDIADGYELKKIYISTASDSHSLPSRHAQSKAVDISRVNGKKMSVHYNSDQEVKAIVQAMQNAFEAVPKRRENFGPHIKHKLGATFSVSGHGDHIHFSVN